MLTPAGAKLLDFGLAKPRPLAASGTVAAPGVPTVPAPLTGTGSIVGTYQYMAPEQRGEGGGRADRHLRAWGRCLRDGYRGRAFGGASQVSVIASILKAPARHERELHPGRKTAFQARETRVFSPG